MANPFFVQPANPLAALMIGGEAYDAQRKRTQQDEAEKVFKELGPQIAAGGLNNNVLGQLFGLGTQGVPSLDAAAKLIHAKNDANSVFGNLVYGRKDDGTIGIGTHDKQGRFRPIDTGGFTPFEPGLKTVDTGAGTLVIGGRSGSPVGPAAPQIPAGAETPGGPAAAVPRGPVGYVPKDIGGAAAAKEKGEIEGKNVATFGAAQSALDSNIMSLERLAAAAKEIKAHPGTKGITGISGAFPNIPGGQAANAQALLTSLTSQVGLNALQSLRDASKTGGALGQVTEGEHKILQNYIAALERSQTYDQFNSNLDKLIRFSEESAARQRRAFAQDYGRLPKPGTAVPIVPLATPATPPANPVAGPTNPSVIPWDTYFGTK